MKNKLISAEGQVKSNERKIIEEIEQRAIDLSVEKVRAKLSKSLSGDDYERYFTSSTKSVEKGLKEFTVNISLAGILVTICITRHF